MSARRLWLTYLVLLVLSIPWYYPAGSGEPLLLGFPLWALVSLGCYAAAAALTVWHIDTLWHAQLRTLEDGDR